MRRVLERALAFVERLVDEPDLTLLEVAQAAVHELGALRARARGEVVALDQRGAQAPGGGVERHPGAGDAATDHQDVEALVAESLEGRRPIERTAIEGSPGSGRRPAGHRARLPAGNQLAATGRRTAGRTLGAVRQVSSMAAPNTVATPMRTSEVVGRRSPASVPAVRKWMVTSAEEHVAQQVHAPPDLR